MPRFDYKCPACGTVDERIPDRWEGNESLEYCKHCGALMEKQPAAPNFHITGFNARNGYSHSK